mmetsp:Transcript_15684/g.33373  ORF Transcript_15684/g.33373 Transcript_15684/m.33373 type:complete len:255 (-) Transcript_15684:61-825(-)
MRGIPRRAPGGEAETAPLIQNEDYDRYIKNASLADRQNFVRKVYAILSIQLLVTVAIAAPIQTLNHFEVDRLRPLFWVSVAMSFVQILMMSCCRDMMRKFPINYIMLLGFTGFEGIIVGFLSAQYIWQSVILAAGITVLIFLALTAYAFFATTDFTGMGIYLVAGISTLCCFGFVLMILGFCGVHVVWLMMLYNIIGICVFVFAVIFDTQMIMGEWGGHEQQFSVDDYIHAALALYLDLINLFLHILRLLGDRK